jgi:hypothetical protein
MAEASPESKGQQNEKATSQQAGTDTAERQSNEDVAAVMRPPSATVPEAPPPAPQQYHPARKRRWTNDPAIFWVTLAGVVAVIAYTSVAAWQGYLMREQLEAMKGQLSVAEDDQRPWLKAMLTLDRFIFSGDGDVYIHLRVRLQNIGKSPAKNIQESFSLVPTDINVIVVPVDYERAQCKIAAALSERAGRIPGHFLFPGDEDPAASRNATLKASEYLDKLSDKTKAGFTLIGCYDYTFAGNETRHGRTALDYGIDNRLDKKNGLFNIAPGEVRPSDINFYIKTLSGTLTE